MKKHIKPCNCETCEKARYWTPCSGCKDGHSSFWKTVTTSPQWELWEQEQNKRMSTDQVKTFDVDECRECGWISPEHFQDFIKFIRKLKKV